MATNEIDDQMTASSASSLGYTSLSSTTDSLPLNECVSEAAIYSICGVCAMSFHHLFPYQWDRSFCETTMSELIRHLALPSQVQNAMKALMDGEGGDVSAFIALIKEESNFKSSCVRVVEELVMFAVKEGVYDARLRVLILHISQLLGVPIPIVELYEESVIEMLSEYIPQQNDEEIKIKRKRERNKKIKRYVMIGLASVGGGAIIGLTGGLAAPFVAAGAGAIIGTAGAAVLGSSAGIAVIGSLFGVAGAGLTGYKMKKRVGDIEEFAFDTLTAGRELHLTIAISGWVSQEGAQAFKEPWLSLLNSREQYCIRYESAYLLELGRAMDYFLSFAVSMAAQEALKYTILSGLIAAIAWPATLVTVSGAIDNPWGVCIRRSAEVGKHLAEILIARQQGRRPVTLIGFSLGARVVYYCLQEMAQRKGCEGIIEDVVLLGAPVPASCDQWKAFGRIVSGRIINGYCRGDWLLKFLYRTSSATLRIAGLQAIDWNDRKMTNVDLSHIVTGHMDYVRKMKQVLEEIGVRTVEEPNVTTNECFMRRTHSDITQMTQKLDAMIVSSKSDSNLGRRYSDPLVVCQLNALSKQSANISRRSSSLESILSKVSRNSIGMTCSSPTTTSPELIKNSIYRKSTDFLNVPQ
ncbi:transmembrane and coiled-coil domain-containing protein 4-like isoform X2 [Oppia nitens]|uniref:transmembrane and coiled-coil domain-containing protein 4-like isoform X2 n=1 Tax=Oppia nitens TaxID=1686743 RepID=UPI0023DBCC15|nr:transmembrane and coiled-coil domain-containing protein 4-like isoform X2 [Oppia nitens]